MRVLGAILLTMTLAGCEAASGNSGLRIDASNDRLGLPSAGLTSTGPVKPVCPPELSADTQAEPQLPANAGFPAAEDPEASAAVSLYIQWLRSLALWGRAGWARAAQARAYCQ